MSVYGWLVLWLILVALPGLWAAVATLAWWRIHDRGAVQPARDRIRLSRTERRAFTQLTRNLFKERETLWTGSSGSGSPSSPAASPSSCTSCGRRVRRRPGSGVTYVLRLHRRVRRRAGR